MQPVRQMDEAEVKIEDVNHCLLCAGIRPPKLEPPIAVTPLGV